MLFIAIATLACALSCYGLPSAEKVAQSEPSTNDDKNPISRSNGTTSNIIGGKQADEMYRDQQWMISIQYNNQHFCGGTMFGKNLLLTAAHCSTNLKGQLQNLRVVAKLYRLSEANEFKASVIMTVAKITINPHYDWHIKDTDVAVWELRNGEQIKTFVDLDTASSSETGLKAVALGWGTTRENSANPSPVLKQVSLTVMDAATCRKQLQLGKKGFTKTMMCAGGVKGQDTCSGDSGGPLIKPMAPGQHRPVQIGITSWGYGCGHKGQPGVYTKISAVRDWIMQQSKKR